MEQYSAFDRQVFPYFDGATFAEGGEPVEVYADPREIDRAMAAALGGDVDATIDLCREYEVDADGKHVLDPQTKLPRRIQLPDVVADANRRLCDAVRKSFQLEPFNRLTGKGATQAMCIKLWNAYQGWVEKKETPAASSPTS